MQDILDTIADNQERVKAIIQDVEELAATLADQRAREKNGIDNTRAAALALFKALGWEK